MFCVHREARAAHSQVGTLLEKLVEQQDRMATSNIVDLPDEVLTTVVIALTSHAHGNPGDVCRLMLSCRKLRASMQAMDLFWQRSCVKQGWGEPPQTNPPVPPQFKTPFAYYSRRMLLRWQVRSAFRRVVPFLNYNSQFAVQKGASLQQLKACEARLGVMLPWQFWEMYRFRNGQGNQLNIDFAYGGRLLSLAELSLETTITSVAGVGDMQQVGHHADMTAHRCSSVQQAGDQAETAMLGKQRRDLPWLLPFTHMFSKRRQFAVDGLGRVHLIIGFTCSLKADSCSAFLQSLLR